MSVIDAPARLLRDRFEHHRIRFSNNYRGAEGRSFEWLIVFSQRK